MRGPGRRFRKPVMTLRPVSLDDKYDLNQSHIFVTGYQALIRACLCKKSAIAAPG